MDIELGAVGDTKLVMEAVMVSTTEDEPRYDMTAVRLVRLQTTPVLTRAQRKSRTVVGPRESAGVAVATISFAGGGTHTLTLDEEAGRSQRVGFPVALTNTLPPGVAIGWHMKPVRG